MSTALICLPRDMCPSCGGPLSRVVWDQLPLLRHGGYGAAARTTVRYCMRCPYAAKPDRIEVNPLSARR